MVVPQKLKDIIDSKFEVDTPRLKEFRNKFNDEIEKGLKKSTHDEAEIKCFVTFVQNLPTGEEKGDFLALDLGGTNFRVLLIHLKAETEYAFESQIFDFPQTLMTGSGEELFDYIAKCLAEFTKTHRVQYQKLPLGFTFSFPCQQVGLTEGNLLKWTKGFNVKDVVGKNVVQLMTAAIEKRNDVKILICAILNDTTGTLMSCAWKNRNCKIGLIVGTGSNCCYVEKAKRAELFEKPGKTDDEIVVINTECGAFGDKGSIEEFRNDYDREVDKNSINVGNQIFEKMISGMYMGELVRLVIVDLVNNCWLFRGILPKDSKLYQKYEFVTKYVSEIESQGHYVHSITKQILNDMGIRNPSLDDCQIVRYVCESVSKRSARLVGSALAALILRINDEDITIGVDGSVFRFHPTYQSLITEAIKELLHEEKFKFKFALSEDGSGRGAALVAAVASQAAKENE